MDNEAFPDKKDDISERECGYWVWLSRGLDSVGLSKCHPGFFIVPNKGMGTRQRKTCYVIIYNLFIHFPYKEKESFETSLSQIWLYPNQD
jgi:hypothetical protein